VNGVIAAIITGLAFFVGLLYAMNENVSSVLTDGISDQPVINIFDLAFKNNYAGSLAMSILLAINVYLGGFSHMTVTTRIVFAMSRDGAFPGSKYIYGVYGDSKLPLKSILFVFVIDSLLVLLPLISDTTFSAITQISTIGYSISYAIPIILRVTVSRNTFVQGPWNLGRFSVFNGVVSSIFLVGTSICFFFPTSFDENMHQTWDGFNYTIVVFTGALLIAATYWILSARHFFKGPIRPEDVVLDLSEMPEEFKEKKFIMKSKGANLSSVALPGQDGPTEVYRSSLSGLTSVNN
jgi:amino acid transporter